MSRLGQLARTAPKGALLVFTGGGGVEAWQPVTAPDGQYPVVDLSTATGFRWEPDPGSAMTVAASVWGSTATAGVSSAHARGDHAHGLPANPVTAHLSAYDHSAIAHAHPYASDTHSHPGTGLSGGIIRKTGNQTMTATSQTAVTDMAFAVEANATYYFQMDVAVTTSSGTSPTSAWGFTGPAGGPTVAIVGEIDTSTSVETNAVVTSFATFAAGAQVANTGAKFRGTVQTGSQAGTVQLTVARGGTTPSMVVAAGSNGLWLKLA